MWWGRAIVLGAILLLLVPALMMTRPMATPEQQMDIARVAVIVLAASLPAVLYLSFIQNRLRSLEKEYRQNLRRLGLPENASLYAEKFQVTYGITYTASPAGPGANTTGASGNQVATASPNGEAARSGAPAMPEPEERGGGGQAHGPLIYMPLFVVTVLSFLGWLLVFYPVTPGAAAKADPLTMDPRADPMVYAFLGAYLVGIGGLARQYVTDDLQLRYYVSIANRYILVIVLAWMIPLVVPGNPSAQLLAAIVIGFFPMEFLRVVVRAGMAPLGRRFKGFGGGPALSQLDGLSFFEEDRLWLEGIESQQSLCCANIVDLMLKTRYPVERIVDWMDQALLHLHARERVEAFQACGVRAATDLLDAYSPLDVMAEADREKRRKDLAALVSTQFKTKVDHNAKKSASKTSPTGKSSTENQTAAGQSANGPGQAGAGAGAETGTTAPLDEAASPATTTPPAATATSATTPSDQPAASTSQGAAATNGKVILSPEETRVLIDTIVAAIRSDPNSFHVAYWRSHVAEALPDDIERDRTAADLALMKRRADEAVAAYDILVGRFPDDRPTRLRRGIARALRRDYGAALADFNLLTEPVTSWEACHATVERGQILIELGRLEEAEPIFASVTDRWPTFAEGRLVLANLRIQLKKYDGAIQALDDVVSDQQHGAEALTSRARARLEQWRDRDPTVNGLAGLEQARRDLLQATSLKPDMIGAYLIRAEVLEELGELDECVRVATTAMAHADAIADAVNGGLGRVRRGRVAMKRRSFPDAVVDFRQASRLVPHDPEIYWQLGDALRRVGELTEAENAFRAAVALSTARPPDRPDGVPLLVLAQLQLAAVLHARKAYQAAIEVYASILEWGRAVTSATARREAVDAVVVEAHLGLGRCYFDMNPRCAASARRHLQQADERATELNADSTMTAMTEIHAEALYRLGRLDLDARQFQEAADNLTLSATVYDTLQDARSTVEASYRAGEAFLGLATTAGAARVDDDLATAAEGLTEARGTLERIMRPNNDDDAALLERIEQLLAQVTHEQAQRTGPPPGGTGS
jgi:tetratricopeptide (TPR) repeat protein